MSKTALQDSLDAAQALLRSVDRNDSDAMFDCLVELEMLTRDAVADHGVAELLDAAMAARQGELDLRTAA